MSSEEDELSLGRRLIDALSAVSGLPREHLLWDVVRLLIKGAEDHEARERVNRALLVDQWGGW